MHQALLVIFLLIAICLIALIMLQQGKGADIGASFSTGISGTLFGSSGSGNFMTRITVVLAVLFFIFSLALDSMSKNNKQKDSQWDLNQVQQGDKTPVEALTKPSNDVPQ